MKKGVLFTQSVPSLSFRGRFLLALLLSIPFLQSFTFKKNTAFEPPHSAPGYFLENTAGTAISADVLFTKETYCVEQAASGIPGNIDVTFRMRAINIGLGDLTSLQITEDLIGQIPLTALFGHVGTVFGPDNNLTTAPTFNIGFNGITDFEVFEGTDGLLRPTEVLAIDMTVELDANELAEYGIESNQSFFTADNGGLPVGCPSDAPIGAPGDTGADDDPLLLRIPAINLAVRPLGYDPMPTCDAGGEVEVTLELCFRNTGNVTLDRLLLEADLESTLGAALLGTVGDPVFSSSSASQNPTLNLSFDGTLGNDNLFNGTSGLLAQDEEICVQTRLRIDPNAVGALADPAAQFFGGGRGLFADLTTPLPGCHDDDVLFAFDFSDAGDLTEDINAGFIGDMGGHDDPLPLYFPQIEVVKDLVAFSPAISQAPGNLDVRFRLLVENTGNVGLNNLALVDFVDAQLGSAFVGISQLPLIIGSNASSPPNPGLFPGDIFDGTGGLLEPGQFITVEFAAEVNPDAAVAFPLTNQAGVSASGLASGGGLTNVVDLSDTGNQTESTNPGEPGDTGCASDPTQLLLPAIMVAQEIVGVDYATSGTSGHFDAIVEVVVQNTGSVDLMEFQLLQDLTNPALLGSAFVTVTGAPEIVPVGAHGTMTTANVDPTVNPAYNGNGDLLNDFFTGLLEPGQIFVLRYRVEVNPEAAGAPVMPKFHVEGFAEGDGPFGSSMTVDDSSDAGHTPQSTNPDAFGDTGGTDDPTLLTNCGTEIGALSCNHAIQVSLNEDCLAGLTPAMILEGEIWYCASDDLLPLGAYYKIFMVTDAFGNAIPDAVPSTPNVFEIDGSFIGQILTVKVNDVVNSNSCWGTLTLEDKTNPTIDCPATFMLDCFEDLTGVPVPTAQDNCDPDPQVLFVAQHIIDNDICDDGLYRLRRTYTAHDQYGNTAVAPCTFEIHFTRPDLTFPEDIDWFCEQYNAFPNIIDGVALHPIVKDEDLTTPVIDVDPTLPANVLENTGSGTVNNTGGVCSYNVSHSDEVLNACGGTFKIIRTWTVVDWCTGLLVTTGANGEDNIQYIKIIDETAPVISKTDFEVNANIPAQQHLACRSTGVLPAPDSFSDNCQDESAILVQIITPIGEAAYFGVDGRLGGTIPPPGLPLGGPYPIEYLVTDACGNSSSDIVMVQIVDTETPAAVCDELTEANLTSLGMATVNATTFDDGSHDNCCLAGNFQVRRMADPCDDGHDDTQFGPSVTFCCDDVATSPHMVVFRVTDCFGNFNDCMVQVVVNDKQAPLLVNCPPDARITCDDYAADFQTQVGLLSGNQAAQNELFDASFGMAMFMDNCGFDLTKTFTENLSQCQEGSLVREWTATDPGDMTSPVCTQNIFVDHVSDWAVEFPADLTVNCGQPLPPFEEPEIFFDECEMVATSFEDAVFTIVNDACFKVERTWTVINWCVLGQQSDQEFVEMPENLLGLPFPDCDLDGDGDCDDRTYRDSWANGVYPGAADANTPLGPDTDLDSDPWDGYIVHTQTIKFDDNVAPVFTSVCDTLIEITITDTTCVAEVTLPLPEVDDCNPNTVVTASSVLGTGTGPFDVPADSTVTITYTAMDGCTNQSSCQATLTVIDGKGPTAFCKTSFSATIMPTSPPFVLVYADSLDDGSSDNCMGELTFSFSSDPTFVVDSFFCHQQGPNPVEMWVTDEAGNQDFCSTEIIIDEGNDHCPLDTLVVNLSGVIDTETGQPVQEVNIVLSGQNSGSQTTPLSGDFTFENIPAGNDVTLTPSLDSDPRNGVSTFDLLLISQHILGISALDSPYKLIAADVNGSGSISTFDLLELRKLILFIYDEFPNNSSWRFVDKGYLFPNANDPWGEPFPEVINVNNIPADVLDADFVAIKIGDVNGSASTSLLDGVDDRNFTETIALRAEERNLTRGEKFDLEIEAPLDLSEKGGLLGFQFTLQFDASKLEFVGVENAQLEASHFGFTFLEKGCLTVSWDGKTNTGTPLAALRFRALGNFRLGNAVQLNSRYTPAEAYSENGKAMGLGIQFTDGSVASHFELYQNVPNPFSDATVISFHLPRASMATLTITDVRGRTVRTVTDLYEAGYNEIELGKDQLPTNGIFYYRLETPTDSDTKTMILLD